MLGIEKRIVVVVGHYGSGKTNLAVNLALDFQKTGDSVVLVDLDIVNPYFRSADFTALMEQNGIELAAPTYARTNLDLPALTGRLDALLDSGKRVIVDVGGDDAGAAALGRYSASIQEAGGCEMLYVVNGYRYLTKTADEARDILREIQAVSRLQVTGVINCSNLAEETTVKVVEDSMVFARQTAEECGVPLLFTAVDKRLAPELKTRIAGEVYPVEIYVKKPWDL